MPVTTHHPDYDKMLPEWQLVRACIAGPREVKALKRDLLPAPGEYTKDNKTNYDQDRYAAYLCRAIYVNVTGRTKEGLSGLVFRNDPEIDLPSTLEYLNEDADGSGQSLTQLTKDVQGSLFGSGREILLVDYPEVPEGLTREQFAMVDPKAHIKRYTCENLINWKTATFNGVNKLTLAVLEESEEAPEDEFDNTTVKRYRVLRLRDGSYTVEIRDEDDKIITPEFSPRKANGSAFDEIPMFIIGSQNNDPSVDEIPLADIAHVNVGHYRNSADLEENCHIHGQLTLGMASKMSWDEFKTANPNGVRVGARTGHYLGDGGGFTSIQADANQLADTLMERKEEQMVKLGARLIEKRNPNETATQSVIDATGQNSVLADLVTNVEEGIVRAIQWCGQFMGDEQEFTFVINRQFYPHEVDATLLSAALQQYDRGLIAKADVRAVSRKAGLIEEDRTDEDIDDEVSQTDPLDGPEGNPIDTRSNYL